MLRKHRRIVSLLTAASALSLGACGTSRHLPPYEPPLARTRFQQVHTTAYTDSESDHEQYGNRTALGGILHAAAAPIAAPRAIPIAQPAYGPPRFGYQPIAYLTPSQPFVTENFSQPVYGSAAADWSRWPAGTIFRVVSTGQLYRVEDYGWALSGRNTIDLYMATSRDMNGWGVRDELIQIVQWGDAQESLRRLAPHQKFRHIHRMVLELEGKHRAAANLD
jgi:3D (Asp-Asp-Asp) domain-containing protein